MELKAKQIRFWKDWGRRGARLGFPLDQITRPGHEKINEQIVAGYEREMKRRKGEAR